MANTALCIAGYADALQKSVCCQSADPTITADLRPQFAVRTRHSQPAVTVPCVIVDKRAVSFRLPCTRG